MSPCFEATDLHFAYPHRPPVLAGASMTLVPGERLAITGPNGAGKSTLMQILVGLLRPQAGRVVAFGTERREEADFAEVRRRAGYVFQDPDDQLFCPTVAEDIAFGPLNIGQSRDEALRTVTRVLDQVGLTGFADRVTHKLSGGEKRLVSLASVLAMEPDVLLLDEPTNALDEETTDRMVTVLNALPQAMIVISHDAHFRRKVVTRTLRLRDGVLVDPQPTCRHAQSAE
ncbi:ABC transporter ATP-binding protein [Roseospira marina]|uniref:ABC transporter ATP-binding protein n=1 Tax=Roseospira marina TaxID=140057 RepID=A0A5M6IBD8_9PROT|nr:ABC transporter ATP-binding protein [Roseospira marina]KAA5605614.1 ABC transporter ATP-binding protein [Roseospira marina]MBB4313316.1 cobalt/nickel transport system ATP-binding protein [Roseospira marina]MBB5085943.1 cobalt/nickel transport system ATP-binding protein [Roseospira marina]